MCGNNALLDGPVAAPAGSQTVAAGDDSGFIPQANTTYWFAPGTHTIGSGIYSQILAANNDTFIGAPGAVLSGQDVNQLAFTGSATGVTIQYLTIEDFVPPGGQAAVNASGAIGWTIENDTIAHNGDQGTNASNGSGLGIGSNIVVNDDCFTSNGTAGLQTLGQSLSNISVTNSEMSYNGISLFPIDNCGCAAGMKTFKTTSALFQGNYVHDNYGAGLWVDTDNVGFTVEDNDFARNYNEALIYEISYNALVQDNLFVDNGWGKGSHCAGCSFTYGPAIYLSNSGGDSRLSGQYPFLITANQFTDNWDGIGAWQDPDRFGGPGDDAGDGVGTLVDPAEANYSTCINPGLATAPLFSDCQWKYANVTVTGNNFSFNPAHIENNQDPTGATIPNPLPNIDNAACANANSVCGVNAMFSIYGSYAPFSGWVIPTAVSNSNGNVWSDNCYGGPWNWWNFDQGEQLDQAQWTGGFTDTIGGSGVHVNGQDAGSTFGGTSACLGPGG